MNCCKKCMSTAVIAHSYATPVFQPGKHIFYLVTLAILLLVVIFLSRCIFSRWNAGSAALISQKATNPLSIITPVSKQCPG